MLLRQSKLFLITWLFATHICLASRFNIEVKDGLISIIADNISINKVIKELSIKTGIPIGIYVPLKDKISINVKNATIEEILKRLCKNRAIIYVYIPKKRAYKIVSAKIYKSNHALSLDSHPIIKKKNTFTILNKKSKLKDNLKSKPAYKKGELLIRFKKGISKNKIKELHSKIGSIVLDEIEINGEILQRIKLTAISEKDAIHFYVNSDIVKHVERHALRYINEIHPNDPRFIEQWAPKKIQLQKAWELTKGSPSVIIAVVDSGVDYTHPDLFDNIWVNRAEMEGKEGVDDDGNGYIDDIHGWDFAENDNDPMDRIDHGTNVAGIISAVGNNGIGITGTAWNIKIMPVKVVLDNDSDGGLLSMDIIKALLYALKNGARVVNCSFGGEAKSEEEILAFLELRRAGIIAVCASGNDGKNNDMYPVYPASYDLDNIISVGASDKNDYLASFSDYGKESVDLLAPGVDILTTSAGGYYIKVSGTSIAAPFVSGVIALIISKSPFIDYYSCRLALLNSVDKIFFILNRVSSGGRINALRAICRACISTGDLSCDGKVGIEDAILALQAVSGLNPDICPVCMSNSNVDLDINGDKRIGIEEAIYIMKFISN